MDAINAATLREFHDADDVDGVDVEDPYNPNEELPFDISAEEPSNATVDSNSDEGKHLATMHMSIINISFGTYKCRNNSKSDVFACVPGTLLRAISFA